MTVENGSFYTRADGRLCAYQTVTVKDASKLVAAGNAMISESLLADRPPEKPGDSAADKDEEMIRRAASDRHAWLKLEPGRLSLTVPVTPDGARRMKRELLGMSQLEELLKQLEPAAPEKPGAPSKEAQARTQLEQMRSRGSLAADNPWSFDQRRDRVIVSLGVGDGEPVRVDFPATPREASKVDGELSDYARTLPVKFRKGVTLDSLIEEFRKEHGGKGAGK
jgi:hypothetical protein